MKGYYKRLLEDGKCPDLKMIIEHGHIILWIGSVIYSFWWVLLPHCSNMFAVVLSFVASCFFGPIITCLYIAGWAVQFLIEWQV